MNSAGKQLIAKTEAVRGVYGAPSYDDDFNVQVYDLNEQTIDAGHTGGNAVADGLMGKSKSLAGRKQTTIEFWADMVWSGDIAVAPKSWKFLEACGLTIDETGANATATMDGRPSFKTLSMDMPIWNDTVNPTGVAEVIAGACGSVEIGAEEVGGEIKMKFSFTGKVGEPKTLTAGTFKTPTGVDTADGLTYLGCSVVKGATSYKAWSWNVAMNGDVQPEHNANDTTNGAQTGIDFFKVGNVAPSADMSVTRISTESDTTDTFDNVDYTSLVITMPHFEITLSGEVQNVGIARSNNNETATDDINVKFNYIQIKQVA